MGDRAKEKSVYSHQKNLISVSALSSYHYHPRPSCRCRCHHHHFRSDPIGGIEMTRLDSTRLDSCQTHTCRHTQSIYIYIDILEIHIYYMTYDIIKKHTKIKTSNT